MRVLVADDDRDFCHLLSQVFQGRGWEVVPAYDAMQAVMYARGTPQPDVIVLDIAMPGGTGLGALEKLKASAKTEVIPVVVVSGSIEVEVADQAKARGAVEFLSKPVDPEALALLLEGLIPGRGPGATGIIGAPDAYNSSARANAMELNILLPNHLSQLRRLDSNQRPGD